jgi:hypothetical protein
MQPFGGINRAFSQNPDNSWRFTLLKMGYSATMNPLP